MDQKDTSHHWGLPLNDKNDTSGIVNTDHMHNVVSIFHDANSINLELFYCESRELRTFEDSLNCV